MNKRFKKLITATLLVLLAITPIVLLRKLDHSLIHHGGSLTGLPAGRTLWLNSNDAVSLQLTASDSGRYRNSDSVSAELCSLKAHTHVSVVQLNSYFARHSASIPEKWSISPDRNWLLFQCDFEGNGWNSGSRWSAFSLNHPELPVVAPQAATSRYWGERNDAASWLPDSERIITSSNDSDSTVLLASLRMPWTLPSSIPFPHTTLLNQICTRDGALYQMMTPENKTTEYVEIVSQGINPSRVPRSTWRAKVPATGTLLEAAMSPNASHILWSISSISHSRMYTFVKKLFPRYAVHFAPRDIVAVYLTDSHGDNVQWLGSEDAPVTDKNSRISNLSWLPDSRSFSFLYKAGVYRMDVAR
jgi:hypothetical protein